LDNTQKAKIIVRIERLKPGLYGNCKIIAENLKELKFDSGLRIYFYEENEVIVILLNGGSKQRQSKDIETAKKYVKDYLTNM
jgi:putative addiction module killer protein